MHTIMPIDPNSRILPGQVAMKYMNKMDLTACPDLVESFLEMINRKVSDTIPLREAEDLR